MRRIIVASLLLAILILSVPVTAATYPTFTGYVNDFANILTPAEEASLNSMIVLIEHNTTVEMAVLTIQNTNGEDKVLYAAHAGDQNGVGKKATDNGIVIMWSLDNVKGGAIATGRGVGSNLPDSTTGPIGRDSRPYFDRGEYYNGFAFIISGLDKVLEPQITATQPEPQPDSETVSVFLAAAILMAIVIILGTAMSGRTRSHSFNTSENNEDHDDTSSALAAALLAGTITSGRHHHYDDDDSSSWGSGGSDSSGGGGFGGFGGGGFGGGGSGF
jgi:uncharacterized protein